eukprot:TRINITY_DN1063_c0_g3_i1.p1 TRINITY_DN1063_c0_g3~~TRINITY_DN1063_c0_g3_i1.p1  ORF type:complete len:880 (+),score=197.55 TRINITY_DN1063_c0_g3_i1:316-2640(+)
MAPTSAARRSSRQVSTFGSGTIDVELKLPVALTGVPHLATEESYGEAERSRTTPTDVSLRRSARSSFAIEVPAASSAEPVEKLLPHFDPVVHDSRRNSTFSEEGDDTDSLHRPPLVCSRFFVAERRKGGDPVIVFSYPCPPDELARRLPNLATFCFPEHETPSSRAQFTFTLSNGQRNLTYGHALRISATTCICCLSRAAFFGFFNVVLPGIAEDWVARKDCTPAAVKELCTQRCPGPGGLIACSALRWTVPPITARFPLADVSLAPLVDALGEDGVSAVLRRLLEEGRVLLVDDNLPRLAAAAHAAAALLCPLEWPHTIIPVLPPGMLDVACVPAPWIIGVHESAVAQLQQLPLESCLVCDLSRRQCCTGAGDVPALLPGGSELAKELAKQKSDTRACLDAILTWFVEATEDVLYFCKPVDYEDRQQPVYHFDDGALEAGLSGLDAGFAAFLQEVAGTMMFQLWLQNGRRGPGDIVDAFGEKLRELYPEHPALFWCRTSRTPPSSPRRRVDPEASAITRAVRRSKNPPRPTSWLDRVFRWDQSVAEDAPAGGGSDLLFFKGQSVALSEGDRSLSCTVVELKPEGDEWMVRLHHGGCPSSSCEWMTFATARTRLELEEDLPNLRRPRGRPPGGTGGPRLVDPGDLPLGVMPPALTPRSTRSNASIQKASFNSVSGLSPKASTAAQSFGDFPDVRRFDTAPGDTDADKPPQVGAELMIRDAPGDGPLRSCSVLSVDGDTLLVAQGGKQRMYQWSELYQKGQVAFVGSGSAGTGIS